MKRRPVKRNSFYEGMFPAFDFVNGRKVSYGSPRIRVRRQAARAERNRLRGRFSAACESWRRPFSRKPLNAHQRKRLRQRMGQ